MAAVAGPPGPPGLGVPPGLAAPPVIPAPVTAMREI
jgi:hypothetical protein